MPGSAAETGAAACRLLARRLRQAATAALRDAEATTRRLAAAPARARIATSHAMDASTWPHRRCATVVSSAFAEFRRGHGDRTVGPPMPAEAILPVADAVAATPKHQRAPITYPIRVAQPPI